MASPARILAQTARRRASPTPSKTHPVVALALRHKKRPHPSPCRVKKKGVHLSRLRQKDISRQAQAQQIHAPPPLIPEHPTKSDLLYVFQRRMICSACAWKRGLRRQWQYSDFGAMDGSCQTCGEDGCTLREVMCVQLKGCPAHTHGAATTMKTNNFRCLSFQLT